MVASISCVLPDIPTNSVVGPSLMAQEAFGVLIGISVSCVISFGFGTPQTTGAKVV